MEKNMRLGDFCTCLKVLHMHMTGQRQLVMYYEGLYAPVRESPEHVLGRAVKWIE